MEKRTRICRRVRSLARSLERTNRDGNGRLVIAEEHGTRSMLRERRMISPRKKQVPNGDADAFGVAYLKCEVPQREKEFIVFREIRLEGITTCVE